MKPIYVGVDVSRESLDVLPGNSAIRYFNQKVGLRRPLKFLGKLNEPVQIMAGPTGDYERKLAGAL